VLAKILQLDT